MSPPAWIKALHVESKGKAVIQNDPLPKLRDDYLLVRVKAVGLNPTDWRQLTLGTEPGAKLGCDYAGVVEEVGSKLSKPFSKGDRVAGFAHGS
jgi:NADPH:quinone reductase-like Zn-dependent oxidoreductase